MKSVYIHIPFCHTICSYCGFCKMYYNSSLVLKYLSRLREEIILNYKKEEIETIYIGGGTPSSLEYNELVILFDIIKIFKLSKLKEFTIEVNPESITVEKLNLFKDNMVNRISMGVETTNPKYLKMLNRMHNYQMVCEKINLIKKTGIENINVDLIYGLPNQTIEEVNDDINNILKLGVNHISTYSLMIEDNTLLKINKTKPIDEDLDYLMYQKICYVLQENGFNHYEISNFSKENCESLHNLVYWNNEHYYGFGLSSAGYIDNIRYTNTKSLAMYLNEFTKNTEVLSNKDIISYALILGLRKIKGLNKNEFNRKYNVDILNLYNVRDLIKERLLIDDGSNIYINYDNIYIENSILINFVGE